MSGNTTTDNGLLRFTTAGSVDDGKSTLIGRLLFDSKSIFTCRRFHNFVLKFLIKSNVCAEIIFFSGSLVLNRNVHIRVSSVFPSGILICSHLIEGR